MPEVKFKRDCYGSDALSGLTGRLILVLSVVWHVGFLAGHAGCGRVFLRRLSGWRVLAGFGWRVIWAVAFELWPVL